MTESISKQSFYQLINCLSGKTVSHVWRGFSTAIFIELGKLDFDEKGNTPKGEASLMLEFDWRVEKLRSIYFGSGSGDKKIANGLRKLVGEKIINIETEGRLPELVITFSGNLWLRTFTIYESQPQWTIFLPSGKCLFSDKGNIKIEDCSKK